MRKLLIGTMLLGLALVFPVPTMAGVSVGINIPLPPLIVFSSPPEVVVIPETYVYAVPDVDAEIFFYDGWWWRPWEGRWYRSRHYDSGWAYYRRTPSFYGRVPSGWRNDYRDRRWGGRQWDYQRIPHQQVQQNWSGWKKSRHWEKQNTWGVQGLEPRPRAKQPSRAAVKPQPSRMQPREVQPQRSQPPHRESAQQSKPPQGKPEKGHGKPERGEKEKQGEREKQDRR